MAVQLARTVLVIDDEKYVRDELEVALVAKGYLPTLSEDGEKALDLILKESFDAILLDVRLPGISGHEVLRAVRASDTNSSAAIFLITGLTALDDTLRILHLGVDDYIVKGKDFVTHVLDKLYHTIGPSPIQPPGELLFLGRLISQRKKARISPFLLVLGAGCSLASGCSSFPRIVADLLHRIWGVSIEDLQHMSEEDKEWRFDEVLSAMGEIDRRAFLTQHLTHRTISPGYVSLARMLKEGYFRTVLTTNLDKVLEQQLYSLA